MLGRIRGAPHTQGALRQGHTHTPGGHPHLSLTLSLHILYLTHPHLTQSLSHLSPTISPSLTPSLSPSLTLSHPLSLPLSLPLTLTHPLSPPPSLSPPSLSPPSHPHSPSPPPSHPPSPHPPSPPLSPPLAPSQGERILLRRTGPPPPTSTPELRVRVPERAFHGKLLAKAPEDWKYVRLYVDGRVRYFVNDINESPEPAGVPLAVPGDALQTLPPATSVALSQPPPHSQHHSHSHHQSQSHAQSHQPSLGDAPATSKATLPKQSSSSSSALYDDEDEEEDDPSLALPPVIEANIMTVAIDAETVMTPHQHKH